MYFQEAWKRGVAKQSEIYCTIGKEKVIVDCTILKNYLKFFQDIVDKKIPTAFVASNDWEVPIQKHSLYLEWESAEPRVFNRESNVVVMQVKVSVPMELWSKHSTKAKFLIEWTE